MSSSLRLGGVAALASVLVALPVSSAAARPTEPVAHAAVVPLAVPVASFILKELAVGALNKLGAEGMGTILSQVGVGGDPNTEKLKVIDEKLDRIEASVNQLSEHVTGLTTALANTRLSAVRTSLRDLVGRVQYGRSLLQKLSDGSISDPTLRAEKREELLTLIRDKLMSEQNTLFEGMVSAHGNDDVLHTAFNAERLRHRFFNPSSWHRAASIVTLYSDVAAELLMLRVEYEMSFVRSDSTPAYVAQRQALAQGLIDRYHEENARVQRAFPNPFGHSDHQIVVDTKPNAAGHHLVWTNDERFQRAMVGSGDVAGLLNQYQDPLPTMNDVRFIVSGRPAGQSPPDYLHSQNFTLPLTCGTSHTVEWVSDFTNGRRWAWGAHDDGQGQLASACMHLRVRQLRPGERYWVGG